MLLVDEISGFATVKILDRKAQNTKMLKLKIYMKFSNIRCNE